jgi:hypothetical protein
VCQWRQQYDERLPELGSKAQLQVTVRTGEFVFELDLQEKARHSRESGRPRIRQAPHKAKMFTAFDGASNE